MKRFIKSIFLVTCLTLVAFLAGVGCKHFTSQAVSFVTPGEKYYLAYNLHADPSNNRLYSVNYQIPGNLLKWGTPVQILNISDREIVFRDLDNNLKYHYYIHRRTLRATTLKKHFNRVFTKNIKALKAKVAHLSSIDKKGIEEGKVLLGMSKQGVIIAIGYPPEFATPNPMKSNKWHYWYNRWTQFYVLFGKNGKVIDIIGHYY